MVYAVSCTTVYYVTVVTLFIKKVGVVRPIFFGGEGGSGSPPTPSVVAPLLWYKFYCNKFELNEVEPQISELVTRRRSVVEYWKHFVALFNDVHASGYNSAGSVRIRMKFGALRVYCLELALRDFGRDPSRSESGRWSRNFVFFCEVNNARLCRFPVSHSSRNLHKRRGSMWPCIVLENICEYLPVRGLFLPKRQILGDRLQRLRTSGRDISEMITNLGKS